MLGCAALVSTTVLAQPASREALRGVQSPAKLAEVSVVEKLEAEVPGHLAFRDATGEAVTLGELVHGKPTILTLAYYRCPMLCGLVLNAVAESIAKLDSLKAGLDYQVVTVSFDPSDTPEKALARKATLVDTAGIEEAQTWRFLVGTKEASQALADAVGYAFSYDAKQKEYAHPAAIILLSPEGRVMRYLYGLKIDPKDLRLALLESERGNAKSTLEQVLLYCYRYDPAAGSYVLAAERIMTVGGALTAVLVVGGLAFLWMRERRRRGTLGAA